MRQFELKLKKRLVRMIYDNEQIIWYAASDVMSALAEIDEGANKLRHIKRHHEEIKEAWDSMIRKFPILTPGGAQLMQCVNENDMKRILKHVRKERQEAFKKFVRKAKRTIASFEKPSESAGGSQDE